MATYRQIHTKMWRDRKVEKLNLLTKLLFIYFWSNDHRNELCLYEITIKTISDETGIPLENLPDTIAELNQYELAYYDFDNEVVWIPHALRYQTVTPKSFISIIRNFSQVNSPLAEKAAITLKEVLEKYSLTMEIPLEYLSNGIPIVSEYKAGKGKGKGKGKRSSVTYVTDKSNVDNLSNATEKEKGFSSKDVTDDLGPQSFLGNEDHSHDDQCFPLENANLAEPTNGEHSIRVDQCSSPKPKKVKLAEFVSMTQDEYAKLIQEVGDEGKARRCIEILDDYKGASGKKYKSDYRAIRTWVISRLEEEQRRKIHNKEDPRTWMEQV